ncbi:MAG: ORF6N domain-containing protein [Deltaproteobacteria bacterium]|nr:ORF6N domain-containing protein [Deltaproteobacteria bacterium]
MLDADLANLYGVTTKRLNEQVKRNRNRFPSDFMFQLTAKEKAEVVAICDHFQGLRFSPVLPNAFSEHGTIMLASVLNSPVAVAVSVQIVRAFAKLREAIRSNRAVLRRLSEIEEKYDAQFRVVFDAIRQLMNPPEPKKRKIGFLVSERPARYGRLHSTMRESESLRDEQKIVVSRLGLCLAVPWRSLSCPGAAAKCHPQLFEQRHADGRLADRQGAAVFPRGEAGAAARTDVGEYRGGRRYHRRSERSRLHRQRDSGDPSRRAAARRVGQSQRRRFSTSRCNRK